MTDSYIQVYLVACITVTLTILLLWNFARRGFRRSTADEPARLAAYQRIRRVSLVFWLIMALFTFMIMIYSVMPAWYYLFMPMDSFHTPVINSIGMLILKIAIAWIVVAQLHIDKELYKYLRNIENLAAMELIWYSEGMLLAGMLLFFVGIFVTITNVAGLVLVVAGLIFFFRNGYFKMYADVGRNHRDKD